MLDEELDKLRAGVREATDLISTTATDASREVCELAVDSATQIRDAALQTAQDARATFPSLEEIVSQAALLPGVSIDRTEFLAQALKHQSAQTIRRSIELSPAEAGVSINKLHHLAGKTLGREARRTTVASMAAGIPGGVAAAITIPADLVQLYAHLIRGIQMLSYLYGWRDTCHIPNGEMDLETRRAIVLFLGVMSGDEQADNDLARLAHLRQSDGVRAALSASVDTDAIAQRLEARMAHRMTGQVVGKSIPLAGAVIGATMSYGGFSDMWKRLRTQLEKIER